MTVDELRAELAGLRTSFDAQNNVIARLERERIELVERATYWRQRAKSAEGHLYASDFQSACNALHRESNYAEISIENLTEVQRARISSAVNAVVRTINAQRDRRRPADYVAYSDELVGKVICDLDLFEGLRDSAAEEAEQHRQCMAAYRPQRQQTLDEVVRRCDALIAGVTDRRDNQNLTHQASNHSVD